MANRTCGKAVRCCRICGTSERLIRSYGLYICGRCFREVARDVGFKKYS
ncbi:MAG: 30S ribosomal protein S14 [archaeon]